MAALVSEGEGSSGLVFEGEDSSARHASSARYASSASSTSSVSSSASSSSSCQACSSLSLCSASDTEAGLSFDEGDGTSPHCLGCPPPGDGFSPPRDGLPPWEGASQEEGLLFEEDGFSAPRHGLPPGRGQPKGLKLAGCFRPVVKKLEAAMEGLPTDTLLRLRSQLPPVPKTNRSLSCVWLLRSSWASRQWL